MIESSHYALTMSYELLLQIVQRWWSRDIHVARFLIAEQNGFLELQNSQTECHEVTDPVSIQAQIPFASSTFRSIRIIAHHPAFAQETGLVFLL